MKSTAALTLALASLLAACGGDTAGGGATASDGTAVTAVDDAATDETATEPVTALAVADTTDCRGPDQEVADLIGSLEGTILMAGDLANRTGDRQIFIDCFLPLYGGDLARMRATPGDNDYADGATNAEAYFEVLGSQGQKGEPGKGWYDDTLGSWQLVVLNSNCDQVGGCGPDSEQYQWLEATLDQSTAACRIAMWHEPRFTSSANYDGIPRLGPMFELLYEAGTEVLVNGHSHHYERFEPLGPNGVPDPNGIATFTVGLGGVPFTQFGIPLPGSAVRQNEARGIVQFELGDGEWSFQFVPVPSAESSFTDAGTFDCHDR